MRSKRPPKNPRASLRNGSEASNSLKLGSLLSARAAAASSRSGLSSSRLLAASFEASSIASSKGLRRDINACCLTTAIAVGEEFLESFFANATVSGSKSFLGNILWTMPLGKSCAGMFSPVSSSTMESPTPQSCGRMYAVPSSPISARVGKMTPNFASGQAKRMSHTKARERPIPHAAPFTAAMVGVRILRMSPKPLRKPNFGRAAKLRFSPSFVNSASWPAQKKKPWPVMTMTRVLGSLS
mmetsp:Transcript_38097/g.109938  ORF Transcript_38097/g.109938 Transcript_38097/m.109938 type:complete len:241 (+) Transcript_38097:752-1474(+)